jgi:hypothetical protein
MKSILCLVALIAATSVYGQTYDFADAVRTRPIKQSDREPGRCSDGDMYRNTVTGNTRICNTSNTWSDFGGGGGGGSVTPGGSNGNIQYNNAGALGGIPTDANNGIPTLDSTGKLQLSEIPAGLPVYRTYTLTVTGSNLVLSGSGTSTTALAAASTQDAVLFTMSAKTYSCGYIVRLNTQFAGTSFSGATVSAGGSAPYVDYFPAFDVLQTAGPTVKTSDTLLYSTTESSHNVTARLLSTGGNWSAATAGSVDITFCTVTRP